MAVGNDSRALRAEEVPVPDGDEAGDRWEVPAQGRRHEVLVHRAESVEQLAKPVRAEGDARREPGRGAERRSAAHPVPDAKDIVRGNAESGSGVGMRRNSEEVSL